MDELFERQSRMLDLKDRLPVRRQIEKRVIGDQDLSISRAVVAAHSTAQQ